MLCILLLLLLTSQFNKSVLILNLNCMFISNIIYLVCLTLPLNFTVITCLKNPKIDFMTGFCISIVFAGVILYTAQDNNPKGDFVALVLVNAHVEFRYDLGGGIALIRFVIQFLLKPRVPHNFFL